MIKINLIVITCILFSESFGEILNCENIDFNSPYLQNFYRCYDTWKVLYIVKSYSDNPELIPFRPTSQYYITYEFDGTNCGQTVNSYKFDEHSTIEMAFNFNFKDLGAWIEIIVYDGSSEVMSTRINTATNGFEVLRMPIDRNIENGAVLIQTNINAGTTLAIEYLRVLNSNIDEDKCKFDEENTTIGPETTTTVVPETTTDIVTTTTDEDTPTSIPGTTTTDEPITTTTDQIITTTTTDQDTTTDIVTTTTDQIPTTTSNPGPTTTDEGTTTPVTTTEIVSTTTDQIPTTTPDPGTTTSVTTTDIISTTTDIWWTMTDQDTTTTTDSAMTTTYDPELSEIETTTIATTQPTTLQPTTLPPHASTDDESETPDPDTDPDPDPDLGSTEPLPNEWIVVSLVFITLFIITIMISAYIFASNRKFAATQKEMRQQLNSRDMIPHLYVEHSTPDHSVWIHGPKDYNSSNSFGRSK